MTKNKKTSNFWPFGLFSSSKMEGDFSKNNDNGWGDPSDPKYGLLNAHGVVLGQHKGKFIVDNRGTHTLIVAPTGGGKSSGPVIMTLLNWRESVIATDNKGELFKMTSGKRSEWSDINVYDPLDKNAKTRINPLLEVRLGSDSINDCTVLASALIPAPGPGVDSYWTNKAREWTTVLLMYVLYCEKAENKHIGYVHNLVARGNQDEDDGFHNLLIGAKFPKAENSDLQKDFDELEKYIRNVGEEISRIPDREAGSIGSVVMKNLKIFTNPIVIKNTINPTFSVRDLIYAKRPQTLYLKSNTNELEFVSMIIRAVFEMTVRVMFENEPEKIKNNSKDVQDIDPTLNGWPKLKDRHNLLFLIDGAPMYKKLDALENYIPLIRAYGGRIILTCQSLGQLENIYGENSSIFPNCGIKMFSSLIEIKEAKNISEMIEIGFASYWNKPYNKKSNELLPTGSSQNSGQKFDRRSGIVDRRKSNLLNIDKVTKINNDKDMNTAILLIESLPPFKIEKTSYRDHKLFDEAANLEYKISNDSPSEIKTIWDNVYSSEEEDGVGNANKG